MKSGNVDYLATRRMFESRQDKINRALSRDLHFGEYINDRWKKEIYLGFGEGTSIYDSCVVLGDVRVGSNIWNGPNRILDGSSGLSIVDNCSISAGVQTYSQDTVQWAIHGRFRSNYAFTDSH